MFVPIAMIIFQVVATTSATQQIVADPKVELVPSWKKLQVGDPLFIRTVVRNTGELPISIYKRIGDRAGGLRHEIRRGGTSTWTRVYISSEGLHTYRDFPAVTLPPGGEYDAYSVMFLVRGEDHPIFAEAGDYEIRLWVPVLEKQGPPMEYREVPSQILRVNVSASEPATSRVIQKDGKVLRSLIAAHSFSDQVSHEEIRDVARQVPASHLRDTLDWLALVREAIPPKPAQVGRDVQNGLTEIRAKSDPVIAEVVGLVLADEAVSHARWVEAQDALASLRSRTYLRDTLEDVIAKARGATHLN